MDGQDYTNLLVQIDNTINELTDIKSTLQTRVKIDIIKAGEQ